MLRRWGAGEGVAELWDAADAGDAVARGVRHDAVAAIAWALQQQVLALDPDVVVLAGGVSRLGERLLEPVCEQLRRAAASAPVLAAADVTGRLRLAPPDVELGALGAARCARANAAVAPVGAEVPGG
jgi:predicted NBD/HSP70 family sugar kinase